jgi:hypothetical protein
MHILLPICGKFTRAQIAYQIFIINFQVNEKYESPFSFYLNFAEKYFDMLRINGQSLLGTLFCVFKKYFFEVHPIFGQKLSKKYFQTVITLHSLSQNASVWGFWKEILV